MAFELKLLKYKNLSALDFVNNCSTYELIEFKNSTEWKCILEKLNNSKSSKNTIQEKKSMENYSNIKIGIITALPKECAAMKMMMHEVEECFLMIEGQAIDFLLAN